MPQGLHEGRIVRGRRVPGAGAGMGLAQKGGIKALRRLHGAKQVTRQGLHHELRRGGLHELDGVRHGNARDDGGRAPGKGRTDAAHEGRGHKGAGRVMDEHMAHPAGHCGEPQAHGILPLRAPRHGKPRDAEVIPGGKPGDARRLGLAHRLGKDKDDTAHCPALGENFGRAPVERRARKGQELLGAALKRARKTAAAARGEHEGPGKFLPGCAGRRTGRRG